MAESLEQKRRPERPTEQVPFAKGGTTLMKDDKKSTAAAGVKTEAKRAGKTAAKKKGKKVKAKPPTKKDIADAELERMLTTPMSQCAALEGLPQLKFPAGSMRLGFPVKVMGDGGLKTSDARRHQANPHLRVSLGYLCEVLGYLRKHGIPMYRMSSDIAPYATHPDMPRFHSMVKESASDLARFGRYAREADVRLSFHPSQFIVLNSENEKLTLKSMWDLDSQAEMLDLMECGPEAVMVVHVGGAYGDRESGWRRWAQKRGNGWVSPCAAGWCWRTMTSATPPPTC